MSVDEIGVLLIDDDAIVREWVAAALGGSRFRVRGSTATAAGVAEVLHRRGADLLLVDQRLPDALGTDLVRELRRQGVTTPAILMTANAERGLNEAARSAGLQGSVLKTGSRGDLLEVMERVAGGETAWDGRHPARTENPIVLSPRERAALELIAGGATNREAAAKLGVEPETVKTLLARAFRKLGARRRAEAVANAKRLGIL
jgi:DNA-binding NarL/FixJ family response regulator